MFSRCVALLSLWRTCLSGQCLYASLSGAAASRSHQPAFNAVQRHAAASFAASQHSPPGSDPVSAARVACLQRPEQG